jgi:hypothetical protein
MSIMMIVLAQALLMVSQKLNVSQITQATKSITSVSKTGFKAAAKPAGKFIGKTVMQSKPVQSITSRMQNSKFATVASAGNTLQSKTAAIQKDNAENLKGLFDNAN